MYSTKEKLNHFRQLSNPLAAEADLALLHEKTPQSTDFTRFDLAPRKNAEDILFALLDVCSHDDIVRNRREFFATQGTDNENNKNPKGTDGNFIDDGKGNENPTGTDGNLVDDGKGNENPTGTDGNLVDDGKGNENPTGTDGNPVDGTPVDNSAEEGNGKQPKKSATPKKKKKSTLK